MSVNFVGSRVPLVDLRTGTITREWYLLFQALFTGSGIANSDIGLVAPAPPIDAALAEFRRLLDEERQAPTVPVFVIDDPLEPPALPVLLTEALVLLGSLRDEVAMLRSAIEDLQKGPL